MGIFYCLGPRNISEKIIIAKEEQLKLSAFTITAIKKVKILN